ncbi:hypothetical protein HOY80DRAFT_982169 [Tuber brumale]|nr:hypothetical protein HOY80DRAFT_982169 [Tuber brumale]
MVHRLATIALLAPVVVTSGHFDQELISRRRTYSTSLHHSIQSNTILKTKGQFSFALERSRVAIPVEKRREKIEEKNKIYLSYTV